MCFKFYVDSNDDKNFISKLVKKTVLKYELSPEKFSVNVVDDVDEINVQTAKEMLQDTAPDDKSLVIVVRTGLKAKFGIVKVFNNAGMIFNGTIDFAYCKDAKDGYQHLYHTLRDLLAHVGVFL